MSKQLKVMTLGATGQTGRHLLTNLLLNPSISNITDAGRRSAIDSGITLGTTRKNAGSAERFETIDRGYPVLFAKLARDTNKKPQTLVYLSSSGASPTSPFLYPKSKGLTELELSALGYDQTIVFRPGYLAGTNRNESRMAESIFGKVMGLASFVTDSAQIPVSSLGLAISKAGVLGYSGLEKHGIGSKVSGKDGHEFWLLGNADAIKLAQLDT
ncbi:uncharacterized protein MELLADRAFT_115845 [Melampsora larici-populina 98AG31]|uniref:NAD(P)-binding domain-containing protein n=1 Tax=Melampsora larici-populina (strain 98AG31 / pathotype 3-4-7) TaxID=747676 RepID=F4REV0_MELLP|nr:uncharacterized protein MELLADRAFT_115845 [Melampsora larici-populina 98AG31]EGG09166.1 hypothetical protein MELLADRAFT_115845 [Melampsora larici-populina 98AG31]